MVHMDYISERRREMQTTLRVLQAYPESKIDLKPAEKSRTAAELVMILAVEERVLQALMQTGSTDPTLLNFEVPSSMAEIISIWQQAVEANDAALAVMSPGDFERPVDFYGMHISLGQALWYENCSTIFITGGRFPCTCAWQGQSCRRSTAPRQMNRLPAPN